MYGWNKSKFFFFLILRMSAHRIVLCVDSWLRRHIFWDVIRCSFNACVSKAALSWLKPKAVWAVLTQHVRMRYERAYLFQVSPETTATNVVCECNHLSEFSTTHSSENLVTVTRGNTTIVGYNEPVPAWKTAAWTIWPVLLVSLVVIAKIKDRLHREQVCICAAIRHKSTFRVQRCCSVYVTLITFIWWKRKLVPELTLLLHLRRGIRFLPMLNYPP